MTRGLGTLARAQGMTEAVWARHANPWSAWTRIPILPLLVLSFWSRVWIGWWALLPLGLLLAWSWINPRAFPPPASTRSWASRAVMGERIWLARAQRPVPDHHAAFIPWLVALAAVGLLPLVRGLWALELWPVLLGLALPFIGKFWFLDRMVWLFDEMSATDPIYRAWLR